jgi:dephospho-CoA kinase
VILGLTGTYCAGKNYIASLLEKRGLPVLDVDKLGHKAIETEREVILNRFGREILNEDGVIDRKLLGARVFGRPTELASLEAIVHPAANRMTQEWISAQGGKPCVINAALLHRSSACKDLDLVILAEAPWLTRLLRARRRDRLPIKVLIERFKSQKDFTSQYFAENTDIYKVENRGYFKFGSQKREEKLEHRIDEILSPLGLSRC